MKCFPIFFVLVAAASAVPCDPAPLSTGGNILNDGGFFGGISTSVTNVGCGSLDGIFASINTALSAGLVSLTQNVGQVAPNLSGCLQPVVNNFAQITTVFQKITKVVESTTTTTINQNIGQIIGSIKGMFTSVDQSLELTYENIGESSKIVRAAITQVSQTIQEFVTVLSIPDDQTIIIKSAVYVAYAVNQVAVSFNQVINQINFNSESKIVIEAVNTLPVAFAEILNIVGIISTKAIELSRGLSPDVLTALHGLTTTISTGAKDVTPIVNQINTCLTANGGAVYGLTQNYSYLVSSLKITVTHFSLNLNTLLGDLNININQVPARYLSVELGSIINEFLSGLSKLVKSGIGYAKIIIKGFPIFGNLYLQLNSSVSELMNYIANISASNLSGNAIQILRNNILSSTNGLTNQMSKIMAAAESEITGMGRAILINIAENSQSLVTDLVILVNTLASNISVSVNLDVLLGKFFSTLTTKSLAAAEYSQYIAKYKQYKFD